MEIWVALISVIVGAVAGTATTLVTTRSRVDLEQRAAFDHELRNLRLPHYQTLHALSERLPREWQNELTGSDLLAIRERFHQWYFVEAGGMFLTEKSREAYFALQNRLQAIGRPDAAGGLVRPVTVEEREQLLSLAHDLRQQLRQDLGTAEAPKVEWTARGATPAPPPSQS